MSAFHTIISWYSAATTMEFITYSTPTLFAQEENVKSEDLLPQFSILYAAVEKIVNEKISRIEKKGQKTTFKNRIMLPNKYNPKVFSIKN